MIGALYVQRSTLPGRQDIVVVSRRHSFALNRGGGSGRDFSSGALGAVCGQGVRLLSLNYPRNSQRNAIGDIITAGWMFIGNPWG